MSDGALRRGPLHWYAVVWWAVWAPVGFVACLAGLAAGPRSPILAMAGLAAVMAALTAVPLDPRAGPSPLAVTGRRTIRVTAARRAASVGPAVLLVGTLVELLGGMVLPLLAIVAITSPWALGCVVRRVRGREPRKSDDDLTLVPTELLCREWRASYARVSAAPSLELLTEEVHRRQEVLDEMEHRHPTGFRAWLATNPPANEDPECFLATEVAHEEPTHPTDDAA